MTDDTLALRYRPRTLDDLAGQPHVAAVLGAAIERQRTTGSSPGCYLFVGPSGTGKTSTARMLAAALNAEVGYAYEPTAIVEVDAASNNGVDDVRELVASAAYAVTSRHRTFVLDECHALSEPAWQALLKGLETPPPNTTWILVTTEAAKVPDTIVGRAITLQFRAVDRDAIVARLVAICQAEQIGAEIEALELLAHRAGGGVRDAIMALDQLHLAGHVTVAHYTAVFGVGRAAPTYLEAIARGDLPAAMAVANAYAAGTGEPELLVDEALEVLAERMAAGADVRHAVAATRALWEGRQRLRANPLGARAALGAITAELVAAFGIELHIQTASSEATGVDIAQALQK